MGGMLPQNVRRALRSIARKPSRLRSRRPRAPVKRIRLDDEARIHVEE
jgi:hypothetical protein